MGPFAPGESAGPEMNKRPLVIAVAGAAATLVAVALLLGVPAADRCAPTGRTFWDCVRDNFSDRYLHRETTSAPTQSVGVQPDLPVDLLANEPDRPPVTFELADVSDDAAIIAQDLPAPVRPGAQEPVSVPPAGVSVPTDRAEAPTVEPSAPVAPLPPGIDTIAFDGSGLVAGTGPEGATIRLYLDGQLAGETSVEDGRWAIEDVDLGAALKQELRVEAIDPATGKMLGSSAFTIEIDLPDDTPTETQPERLQPDPAPSTSPVVEVDPPAAVPVRKLVPPDLIADTSPDAFPAELLTRDVPKWREAPAAPGSPAPPEAPAEAPPTVPEEAVADEPKVVVVSQPAKAPVATPDDSKPPKVATPKKKRALPPLRPVKPRKVSPSVTILEGGGGGSITRLGN